MTQKQEAMPSIARPRPFPMFVYWQLDAKKRFKGPTPADETELRKIEHDMQEAAHRHHAA